MVRYTGLPVGTSLRMQERAVWTPGLKIAGGKLLRAHRGIAVCGRKQRGQGTLGMLERVAEKDPQVPQSSL